MSIPANISLPAYPRFLFAPDKSDQELYIVCTQPLALIWVLQTVPAQLHVLEGPQDEQMLRAAHAFYKAYAEKIHGGN